VKVFDADKTSMIGLPYGEKNYDNMLSHFHLTPERDGWTDRRTDGRTDLLCQYRASDDDSGQQVPSVALRL